MQVDSLQSEPPGKVLESNFVVSAYDGLFWKFLMHSLLRALRIPAFYPRPFFQNIQFSSVQSLSNSLQLHGVQHARLPCPSPTTGACSNSSPSSHGCHPTISSSVIPFSSHSQFFPASGSFPVSHLFPSGGQNIGAAASASVLPINIQD